MVTDEVAFASGQLTYVVRTPNDGSEQRTGPYTAVLRHDWNRGWQVRSWVAAHALPLVPVAN